MARRRPRSTFQSKTPRNFKREQQEVSVGRAQRGRGASHVSVTQITPSPPREKRASRIQKADAPWVAILRWNRSTAGTAAPICCALAPAKRRAPVPDHLQAAAAAVRACPATRGRGRVRRAEAARRDLPGTEEAGAVEEVGRDLRRKRAEAALYMEAQVGGGMGSINPEAEARSGRAEHGQGGGGGVGGGDRRRRDYLGGRLGWEYYYRSRRHTN